VLRNLNGFEGDEARFRSWVFTIAHRRLADDRRRRARRPAVADVGGSAGQAASAATRPATPAGSSMGRGHAHARVGLPVYACGA
jgi:DNA-directed RNA polymerase specialized sigma24 family protein